MKPKVTCLRKKTHGEVFTTQQSTGRRYKEIITALASCHDMDELDNWGYAPLHWAVVNMQYDVVKLLLRAGANPHVPSSIGLSPQKIAFNLAFYDIEQLFYQYSNNLSMAS